MGTTDPITLVDPEVTYRLTRRITVDHPAIDGATARRIVGQVPAFIAASGQQPGQSLAPVRYPLDLVRLYCAVAHRFEPQLPVPPGVGDLGTVDAPSCRQGSHIDAVFAQRFVDVLAQLLTLVCAEPGNAILVALVDRVEIQNDPLNRTEDLLVGGLSQRTHGFLEHLQGVVRRLQQRLREELRHAGACRVQPPGSQFACRLGYEGTPVLRCLIAMPGMVGPSADTRAVGVGSDLWFGRSRTRIWAVRQQTQRRRGVLYDDDPKSRRRRAVPLPALCLAPLRWHRMRQAAARAKAGRTLGGQATGIDTGQKRIKAGLDQTVRADVTSECLSPCELPQPVEGLILVTPDAPRPAPLMSELDVKGPGP
ncbi:hypothetical protein ABZ484_00775 [Streptomyces sp. NPDC006393]|uniref:hypothetical protein n=1 Tax=Streptomyces sp. NPDC006393 TaxID=3156763 RepID=UPI0033ED2ED0